MAERKRKSSKIAEAEEKAGQVQEESTEEAVEQQSVAEEPKQEEPKEVEPVTSEKPSAPKKSYIHIDTFLNTVAQDYSLTRVQRAGFKAYMNNKHYVKDESIFRDSLKQYLNIK